MTSEQKNEPTPWLDRQENINRLVYALYIACALVVIADFFYHKHPYFSVDGSFGFYAVFGFLAYCTIVFGAKAFRKWVKREEDYYDE